MKYALKAASIYAMYRYNGTYTCKTRDFIV